MNFLRVFKVFGVGSRSCSTNKMDFLNQSRKIIGIAANSRKTLERTGGAKPELPIIFFKPPTSMIVEGQDIIRPKIFQTINHEVELGVIIGKTCKNIEPANAKKYIAGYCLALDLTAACEVKRAREKSVSWDLSKCFDTSTPVSRFIDVSEIENHNDIRLWITVNGEMRQDDSTSDMIVSIDELISFLSKYMTLKPNDLILSGTPDGMNSFNAGDVIECGIGDILTMKFNVRDE